MGSNNFNNTSKFDFSYCYFIIRLLDYIDTIAVSEMFQSFNYKIQKILDKHILKSVIGMSLIILYGIYKDYKRYCRNNYLN